MKLGDILKIERRKCYPGGLQKAYWVWDATLLGHTATCNEKDDAIRTVVNAVHQQNQRAHHLLVDTSPDGTVWVLRYNHGWEYCMRGAGRPNYGSWCQMGMVMSWADAQAAMLKHKTQYDADCEVKP